MSYKIQLKHGWRIDKHGKLVKSNFHKDVSARLRERASKKIRIVKRGSV